MDKDKILKIFEFIGTKNSKYRINRLEPKIHYELSKGDLYGFVKKHQIPTSLIYLKKMWEYDKEFVLNKFFEKIKKDPTIFDKYGTNYFLRYFEILDKDGRNSYDFFKLDTNVDELYNIKREIINYMMNNREIINSINERTNPQNPDYEYYEKYWFDRDEFIAVALSYSTDIPGDLKKFGDHGVGFVRFINDYKSFQQDYSYIYIRSLCQNIKNVPVILKYFDSDIILMSIIRDGNSGLKFLEKLISIYPKVVDLILNSEKVFNQLENTIEKLPDSVYQEFKRNNSPLYNILNKK
jgi:hypothetical protein